MTKIVSIVYDDDDERFVGMLLVELSLALDLQSSLLILASLTLSDSDVTAPSTMMLCQMSHS